MRVLFTSLPAYGAFQPLIPVARALAASGHEVAFALSATFCRVGEAAGFRCLPAGVDWSFDDRETGRRFTRAYATPWVRRRLRSHPCGMSSPGSSHPTWCPIC